MPVDPYSQGGSLGAIGMLLKLEPAPYGICLSLKARKPRIGTTLSTKA